MLVSFFMGRFMEETARFSDFQPPRFAEKKRGGCFACREGVHGKPQMAFVPGICNSVQIDGFRSIQNADSTLGLLTNKLQRYITKTDETGFKPIKY